MLVTNLHHLAAPCIAKIRKQDDAICQKDDLYYLNPSAIIRYEPNGAVITPPMLYSSFLFVDEDIVNLLKGRIFSGKGIPHHVLSSLLENEVILKEPTPTQVYREMHVDVSGLPTQVLFEITSFCNCDCITCYHKADLDHYIPPLEDLINRISKLKELGIGLFEVTGGEPFSRNDLHQILNFIKQQGLHFYVVTNGEFLINSSNELIDILKEGLGLAVSLDGVGEIHNRVRRRDGLYVKMMAGLDYLHFKGIKIYFISTLNKENLASVEEMVDVAKKFNTIVHFRPTIKTGAAVLNNLEPVDLARELGGLLKHPNVRNGLLSTKKTVPYSRYYGCGLRKRISVDSRGVLYPCVMDRTRFLGNIKDYSPKLLVSDLEDETKKLLIQNEDCRRCDKNSKEIICGGFCRFSNRYKKMIIRE
ncbi:MAG: radical SAM protein [Parcubacteria group bacterium]|jgi:radical SAM protein with 4Fe4S-binding SPASM domain